MKLTLGFQASTLQTVDIVIKFQDHDELLSIDLDNSYSETYTFNSPQTLDLHIVTSTDDFILYKNISQSISLNFIILKNGTVTMNVLN